MSDHDYATASDVSANEPEPETQPESSSSPDASDPLPQDESDPQGTSAQPKVEEMDSKAEAGNTLPVTAGAAAVPGTSASVPGGSTPDINPGASSSSHTPGPGTSSSSHHLNNAEKNERMRSIFQSGLQLQLSKERMEACKAVETQLFHHQQVGLAWMMNKENTPSGGLRGGILADDMGLG